MSTDANAATRSAFRAFVRDHHPDRGGDPAVFAAGVAAYRRRSDGTPGAGHVVFHHRRGGAAAVLDWWAARRAVRRRPPRVH